MATSNQQQVGHVNCAEIKTNGHALALLHDHHHMGRKGSRPALFKQRRFPLAVTSSPYVPCVEPNSCAPHGGTSVPPREAEGRTFPSGNTNPLCRNAKRLPRP